MPEFADHQRVLLLESIHPDAASFLNEQGYKVETYDGALSESALIERLPGINVLGIRSTTHITSKVVEHAPDLVAIGAFCIGTNQIDLDATARKGIATFNAPYSNTRSVVELAIAEIISMARRLTDKNRDMHNGIWNKSASGAHEVRGRRLGIVGYGNIGSQLSVIAEALGFSVYFYDVEDKLALGNARRCETLEELLETVEVLTLHVDGRAENRGYFGDEEFRRMRPRSLFLNLSRGFVVDHKALRKHIESGHIAGAAVDVFPTEPKKKGESFESDLRGLDNVILTPHVGGSTEEAQQDIGRFVSGKLHQYVAEGNTSLSVNLPALALPEPSGSHRLAYVHKNTPGVLARINGILAEHDVNIESQYLGTRGELGYVITDLSPSLPSAVAEKLNDRPETVRLRVLS